MRKDLILGALAVLIVGAGVGAFLRKSHRSGPATGVLPSGSASAVPPAPSAPPGLPPWQGNPVQYDCSALAPKTLPGDAGVAPEPEKVPEAAALRTFYELSRWDAVAAVPCIGAPLLDTKNYGIMRRVLSALTRAPMASMPPLERMLIQNGAMRVARCAQSLDKEGKKGPNPAQIEALRRDARALMKKVPISRADADGLGTAGRAAVEQWLGPLTDPASSPGRADTSVHERSAAYSWKTHSVPRRDDVDAFYGTLIVVDETGHARETSVPGRIVLRRVSRDGLTVCFAEPSLEHLRSGPVLRAVELPRGPLEVGAIRCDRCHLRGARLSETRHLKDAAGAAPAVDPLLEIVTRWVSAPEEGASKL